LLRKEALVLNAGKPLCQFAKGANMKLSAFAARVTLLSLVCICSPLSAADINQRVANAYNEGIVRCSNPECARYLYACFRSYASATLNEFLACGTQASRLNDNEFVVAPSDQTARNSSQ
jgi:hypothetical protein